MERRKWWTRREADSVRSVCGVCVKAKQKERPPSPARGPPMSKGSRGAELRQLAG